jgi:hypothetical protein
VTPRFKIINSDCQAVAIAIAQSKGRAVIDLDGDVGAQTQFGVVVQGPVIDLETQLKILRRHDGVVAWIHQSQGWTVPLQLLPQLLHRTWWGHFLELPAGGGAW